MSKRAAVIGSGLGGVAAALRLIRKGYKVTVFEKAPGPGGKVNEIQMGGYRFDTGPSIFTLPALVDELFRLFNRKSTNYFSYHKLDVLCKCYYEDGVVLNMYADEEKLATELEQKINEPAAHTRRYLAHCKRLYDLTSETFIYSPFQKGKYLLNKQTIRILFNVFSLRVFSNLHHVNRAFFKDKHVVQYFDRFATYCGSNPYKVSGILAIIGHLEHNVGSFFPHEGMFSIVNSLVEFGKSEGIEFRFNSEVERILTEGKQVKGLRVAGCDLNFDLVVNDTDVLYAYKNLIEDPKTFKKLQRQESSTSVLLFYWGMKRSNPQLEIHNVLFSANYHEEFNQLSKQQISNDPTVYIFISSKAIPTDAPTGCENWYVMINVPINKGQDWPVLIEQARNAIKAKVQRCLGFNLDYYIECERVIDPLRLESQTSSWHGAMYGASSNGLFSAFSRHANFSYEYENLYFTGGSVHPGGGVPLCLASAKIVEKLIG